MPTAAGSPHRRRRPGRLHRCDIHFRRPHHEIESPFTESVLPPCAAPTAHRRRRAARRHGARHAGAACRRRLPRQAGDAGHAVRRRQRPRRGAASRRREARQDLEPARADRQPSGRRRLHRHRGGPACGARRLHAAAARQRASGRAAASLQVARLRHAEGVRPGGGAVPHAVHGRRRHRLEMEEHGRPGRRGEGGAGQGHVWLVGRRQPGPSRRRADRAARPG